MSSLPDQVKEVARRNLRCPYLQLVLVTLSSDPWIVLRARVSRLAVALWTCLVLSAACCIALLWAYVQREWSQQLNEWFAKLPTVIRDDTANGLVLAALAFGIILAFSWIMSRVWSVREAIPELTKAIFDYCDGYREAQQIAIVLRDLYERCDRSDDDVPNHWDVAQIHAYLAAAHRKSTAEAWTTSPKPIELIAASLPAVRKFVSAPPERPAEISWFRQFVTLTLCFCMVWLPLPQNRVARNAAALAWGRVFPPPEIPGEELDPDRGKKSPDAPSDDPKVEQIFPEVSPPRLVEKVDGGTSTVDEDILKDYVSFVEPDSGSLELPQPPIVGSNSGQVEDDLLPKVPKNIEKLLDEAEAYTGTLTDEDRAQIKAFEEIPTIDASDLSPEDQTAEKQRKSETLAAIEENKNDQKYQQDPEHRKKKDGDTVAKFKEQEEKDIERLDNEADELAEEAAENRKAADQAAREANDLREQAKENRKRENEAKKRAALEKDPEKKKAEEKEEQERREEAERKEKEAKEKEEEAKRQEDAEREKKKEEHKKRELSEKKKIRLAILVAAALIHPGLAIALLVLSLLGSKDGDGDGKNDKNDGPSSNRDEGTPGKPSPENPNPGKGQPGPDTQEPTDPDSTEPMDGTDAGKKGPPGRNPKKSQAESDLDIDEDGVVTYTNPSDGKKTKLGKVPKGTTKAEVTAYGDESNPYVVATKEGVLYRSEADKKGQASDPVALAEDPARGIQRDPNGPKKEQATPEEDARAHLVYLLSQPGARLVHNYVDSTDAKRKAWFVVCKAGQNRERLAWCGTGAGLDGKRWEISIEDGITKRMLAIDKTGKAGDEVSVVLDFLVSKQHQFPTNPVELERSLDFSIKENASAKESKLCLVAIPVASKGNAKLPRHAIYLVIQGRAKRLTAPIADLSGIGRRMLTNDDGKLTPRGKSILIEDIVPSMVDKVVAAEWQILRGDDACLKAVSIESDGTVSFVVTSSADINGDDTVRYLPPTPPGHSPQWMTGTWKEVASRYSKRKSLQASLYRDMPAQLSIPTGGAGEEVGRWMDAWAMPTAESSSAFPAWYRDNRGEITLLFEFDN